MLYFRSQPDIRNDGASKVTGESCIHRRHTSRKRLQNKAARLAYLARRTSRARRHKPPSRRAWEDGGPRRGRTRSALPSPRGWQSWASCRGRRVSWPASPRSSRQSPSQAACRTYVQVPRFKTQRLVDWTSRDSIGRSEHSLGDVTPVEVGQVAVLEAGATGGRVEVRQ